MCGNGRDCAGRCTVMVSAGAGAGYGGRTHLQQLRVHRDLHDEGTHAYLGPRLRIAIARVHADQHTTILTQPELTRTRVHEHLVLLLDNLRFLVRTAVDWQQQCAHVRLTTYHPSLILITTTPPPHRYCNQLRAVPSSLAAWPPGRRSRGTAPARGERGPGTLGGPGKRAL